jgi:hypothetical protein
MYALFVIFFKLTTTSVCENYRLFLSNIMYISNSKARKVVYLMMQHITGIPRNQLFF